MLYGRAPALPLLLLLFRCCCSAAAVPLLLLLLLLAQHASPSDNRFPRPLWSIAQGLD
jgi:hypothetical protein